jgi:hypothetical protein
VSVPDTALTWAWVPPTTQLALGTVDTILRLIEASLER